MRDASSLKLTAAAACLMATSLTSADEHAVKRSSLPPAVEAAVRAQQTAGAKVRGLSVETEDGSTYYEAELRVSGHSKDVLIDSAGTVVEVEEEVAVDSLPAAVQHTLIAQVRDGRLVSIEALTRKGVLVGYEAHVRHGASKSEVRIDPEGRLLGPEAPG